MKKLFLVMAVMFAGSTSAFAENNIDRAVTFLDALQAGDMNTVETMMAEDYTFEDPTFGVKHEGRENVLKLYAGYIGDARNLQQHISSRYESANAVVLHGTFYIEMNVAAKNQPKDYLPVMAEGSRVIVFNKEGKIVRHVDLADYGAVQRAIAARAAKAN